MNMITPQKNVLNHSKPGLRKKREKEGKKKRKKGKKTNNKNFLFEINHDIMTIGLFLKGKEEIRAVKSQTPWLFG